MESPVWKTAYIKLILDVFLTDNDQQHEEMTTKRTKRPVRRVWLNSPLMLGCQTP